MITREGFFTPEMRAYLEEKAKGGAAVVTYGEAIVHSKTGRSHNKQLQLDSFGVKQMLAEVKETVADIKKDSGLSSKASVRADFLKEDPKSFETESMSYVQVAAEIIEENEELFALSRLCDRFVPQYLKICKTLEKTVE